MSIPLLLERKAPGMGPKVPLHGVYKKIVVEGLARDCMVSIFANDKRVAFLDKNATHHLFHPIVDGSTAQAEVIGEGSCVNVRLEP
jgi:hypothetical protein